MILCVRWYLRYSLSYHDLAEIMAERGLAVDHVAIWRWVQHYAPLLHQRLRRERRGPNCSWRVDETDVKVAGIWPISIPAVEVARNRRARSHGDQRRRAPRICLRVSELKQSGELGGRCGCRPSP